MNRRYRTEAPHATEKPRLHAFWTRTFATEHQARRVDDLARVPLAFPTYVGVLSRAAYRAAGQIDPTLVAPAHRVTL